MRLADVDRVEVVKGPQSTTYGRNAFAGAINYVTKGPTPDFEAGFNTDIGSYGLYDVNGFVSGPLNDKIRLRLNTEYHSYTGSYKNQIDNSPVGEERSKGARLQVEFLPIDNLSILVRGEYSWDQDKQAATSFMDPNKTSPTGYQYVSGNIVAGPVRYAGDLPGLIGKTWRVSVDAKYDFEDATLSSTSYYVNWNAFQAYDVGPGYGAPEAAGFSLRALALAGLETNQWSEEVRLSSNGDSALKWMGGLYYLHEDAHQTDESDAYFTSCANPLVGLGGGCDVNDQNSKPGDLTNPYGFEGRVTDHYSAYGSVSYDITSQLTFTAEARAAKESIDASLLPFGRLTAVLGFGSFDGAPGPTFISSNPLRYLAPALESKSLNSYYVDPRIALDYKITPDAMVYGSISQGSKPGGFNQLLSTDTFVGQSYKPETLWSAEIGVKSNWLDHKLVTDVTVFDSIWRNQQNTYLTPGSIVSTSVVNAGRVDAYGVEAAAAYRPIPQVQLTGNYAYTISTYSSFYDVSAEGLGVYPPKGNVRGLTPPDVPKNAWTLTAKWQDHAWDDVDYFFGVVESYIGQHYVGSDVTDLEIVPSRYNTDINLGLDGGSWTVTGYVKNLLNDKTPIAGEQYNDLASGTQGVIVYLAPPIQFGFRTSFKFGGPSSDAEATAAYAPPAVQAPAPPPRVARSYMVFFDFNKSDLTSQAVAIVDQAARNAAPAQATQLVVTGHTDTVGSDAYNMRLSRRRAESVAAELNNQGIPSSEIEIVAKGKKDLLVPTADGVREPQNRRVQIIYSGGPTS